MKQGLFTNCYSRIHGLNLIKHKQHIYICTHRSFEVRFVSVYLLSAELLVADLPVSTCFPRVG